MDPKYQNIFWHQGVKLFAEKVLEGKQRQIKVAHLENDVTKALLNLFQHCGPGVMKAFSPNDWGASKSGCVCL